MYTNVENQKLNEIQIMIEDITDLQFVAAKFHLWDVYDSLDLAKKRAQPFLGSIAVEKPGERKDHDFGGPSILSFRKLGFR